MLERVLPFWQGTESAVKTFQTSELSGIPRLYTERHIPAADHRYWVQYTTAFSSAEDVWAWLSVADLRKAAVKAPENIVTLVEVLVMHLESLVDDPLFAPVPAWNPGGLQALLAPSPLLSSSAQKKPADGRMRTQEALNCCRVLTRVIPLVYESPAPEDGAAGASLEQTALWKPRTRMRATRAPSDASSMLRQPAEDDKSDQFVLGDGDESMQGQSPRPKLSDPLQADSAPDAQPAPTEAVEATVGHSLLDTLLELLFHAGFTMPWTDEQLSSMQEDVSRVHFTIWESGIGSPMDVQDTHAVHIERRSEVMRLLLVLLSKPMYVTAAEQASTTMDALEHVACTLEKHVVLAFLCSMLNTVLNYRQADGWGYLPESVFGHDTVRDSITSLCLQVLGALLTYEPRSPPEPERNLFLFYTRKLYRTNDFAFIRAGSGKIFGNCIARSTGGFALSGPSDRTFEVTSEEHVSEWLVVLWTLVRDNPAFRTHVAESRLVSLDMLTWLLFVALTNKSTRPAHGQVQLAVFLLQELTSERSFCLQLGAPGSAAQVRLPSRLLRQQGSVGMDVLIEAVYTLIATTGGTLAMLYPALMLILANTAPFWRNLSVITASRLEQLLLRFSSPSFLLADPMHPRALHFLLEAFGQAIQLQFSENASLVYILVRNAKLIRWLENYDLDTALEAVQRTRAFVKGDKELAANKPEQRPKDAGGHADSGGSGGEQSSTNQGAPATEPSPDSDSPFKTEESGGASASDDTSKTAAPAEAAKPHLTDEARREVAASIGKHGFVATQEWVDGWRSSLPTDILGAALAELVPRVEQFCADPSVSSSGNANERVHAFLREQTLAGVLPPGPPVLPRPFAWNEQSSIWLQNYFWGIVFLTGLPFHLWNDTETRFLDVRFEETPGTASDRVLQSIGALSSALWSYVPSILPGTSSAAEAPPAANKPGQDAAPQGTALEGADTAAPPKPVGEKPE